MRGARVSAKSPTRWPPPKNQDPPRCTDQPRRCSDDSANWRRPKGFKYHTIGVGPEFIATSRAGPSKLQPQDVRPRRLDGFGHLPRQRDARQRQPQQRQAPNTIYIEANTLITPIPQVSYEAVSLESAQRNPEGLGRTNNAVVLVVSGFVASTGSGHHSGMLIRLFSSESKTGEGNKQRSNEEATHGFQDSPHQRRKQFG